MGIDLLACSVMGNHVHLVLRLRPDVVAAWSETEVARHALAVLPVRSGPGLEQLTVTPAVVERYAGNAEDGCTGHLWKKWFTSVALLDAAATLACMVYVDQNPLRAGLVGRPGQRAGGKNGRQIGVLFVHF